ncbi:MAG: T9SS type A sorting domain-containing protein [bacterium]
MKIRILAILIFAVLNDSQLYSNEYWESLDFPSQDTIFSISANSLGYIFIGTLKDGLYRTTDFGNSWEMINKGFEGTSIQQILINNSDEVIIFSRGYGLYKSTDYGESWIQMNYNLLNLSSASKLTIDKNKRLYLSTIDSLYYLEYYNDIWINITPKSVIHRAITDIGIDMDNNLFLIAKGQYSTLFRLKYGYSSWDSLFLSTSDVWNINSMVFNSNNDIIFSSTTDGIILSTDSGESFVKINQNLDTTSTKSLVINKDNHIYGILSKKGVYRSIDNCETWIKIFDYNDNNLIRGINLDNVGYLLGITLDQGLYRSKEPLEIFNINTTILPDTMPIIDYLDTLKLKLIIKDKKYENVLSGTNIKVIDSLSVQEVLLQSDSLGNCVYVTIIPESIDTGLYSINFISSKFGYINDTSYFQVYVKHEEVSVKDNKCETFQIFPNPTSNTIKIQFENNFVTEFSQIKIYSGLGNEIDLPNPVVNGNAIQFDVSSLTQGVYYISVFTGDKFERARFVKINN